MKRIIPLLATLLIGISVISVAASIAVAVFDVLQLGVALLCLRFAPWVVRQIGATMCECLKQFRKIQKEWRRSKR